MDCDASGTTIEAVFRYKGKPISFFNEKLNDAKKYYFYDQESFVII